MAADMDIPFIYTNNTIGLPDHTYIDKQRNRPLVGILRKALNMYDNRQGKAASTYLKKLVSIKKDAIKLTEGKYPLIDYYANPDIRRQIYFKSCQQHLEKLKQKEKVDFGSLRAPSWELITFFKYSPELFADENTFKSFRYPVDAGLTNKIDGQNEEAQESLMLASAVTMILLDELQVGDVIDKARNELLADTVLACATVIGAEVFNKAIVQSHELLDMFSSMCSLKHNQQLATAIIENQSNTEATQFDNETEFMDAIEAKVTECRAKLGNATKVHELSLLVADYAEWIEDYSENCVDAHFLTWVSSLFSMGERAKLLLYTPDNEGQVFWNIFQQVWVEYFQSEKDGNPAGNSLVEQFEGILETFQKFPALIAEAEDQLSSALDARDAMMSSPADSIQARRKKERLLPGLEMTVASTRSNLNKLLDNAALSLLPPGSSLDIFDQESMDDSYEADMGFASSKLNYALQVFANWAAEHESDFDIKFIQNDTGNITLSTESPTGKSAIKDASATDGATTSKKAPETEGAGGINDEVKEAPSSEGEQEPEAKETESEVEKPNSIDGEQAPIDAVNGNTPNISVTEDKPKSVEPDVPVEVVEIEVVEEPLDWCKQALACKADLDRDVFISGKRVNEALATFILNGQVEMATEFSFTLSNNQLSSDHLPFSLFKAAYYGMETWNDRAGFNKARRLLNEINTGELEIWSVQQHAEMAPYLLFMACFQPAIFGGNASTAIALLRDIPGFFDQNTQALIKETIELADRGESVTLKLLKTGGKEDDEAQEFDLTMLDHWVQKIRQSRRGYAPVLKALANSLESGIFNKIETILRTNDKQQISVVNQFVAEYDDIEASTRLLNETLAQINYHDGEGITRLGRQRFHHKVSELVEIARDWLVNVQLVKGSHVEQYCKRFSTRLQKAIIFFDSLAKEKTSHLSRRAGTQLVAKQLKRLQAAISAGDSGWNYSRTKSWYYHPQMLMCIDRVPEEPIAHLNWFLSQLGKPLDVLGALDKAIDAQHIQLAELLRLNLIDGGAKHVPDIQEPFLALRHALISRCRQLDGQLENASLAALIDAPQAEIYTAGLGDILEALEQLAPMDSAEEIQDYLNELEGTLSNLTANTKREMEQRHEELLTNLLSSLGEEAVPESWRADMQDAFKADNLPVVSEMLDELERAVTKRAPIELAATYEVKDVPVLQSFVVVEKQILEGIHSAKKQNELWHLVTEGGKAYGLTYNRRPAGLQNVIKILEEWRIARKPKHSIGKEVYDKIVSLLSMMGVVPSKPQYQGSMKPALNYQTAIGFSSMVMQVKPSPSTRPFSLFGGSLGEHNLPVIVAYCKWTTEQLKEVMDSHHIHDEAIFISAIPMTPENRQEFARFSKRRRKTLLHFDLTIALFLAAQQQEGAENIKVRNFLWLSAPYTYFNPYSGDAPKPPLREMRYGRELQIDSLLKMTNGSAIVFGGRQLGKSTIMQEVQARFHRPKGHQFAFYEMLDKDLGAKIEPNEEGLKLATHKIWYSLYHWLDSLGLINKPVVDHSTKNNDGIIKAVKTALIKNKDARFIAIFDEIDPILNVDSAYDFSIFRGIRDFVAQQDVQGRFKVIIGGLANVKRFENSPNYPLTQMGGSIQVSIMPAQEALHLIIEPLRAAGYSFDSAQVANRILAITNRHPGLLQIFCHELIIYLANNKRQSVGSCVILDEDVVNVSRQNTVMELIRNRFDMTLNLDKRYQVIVYSIINDNRGSHPFYSNDAKYLAECWLPVAFSQLSVKQFEAFLVELVGLGVLRFNDGRYALRNTNVLKLLSDGHDDDVAEKLERAIKDYNSYDPLDRHAYDPSKHPAPMPITCRDEKALLGAIENTDDPSPLRKLDMRQLTATIVVGSEALGILQLEGTLPSLYAEENVSHITSHSGCYKTHSVSTDKYPDPTAFSKKLLDPLMTKRAKEAPQMVFITIGENTTLANLLGMLDAVHQLTEQHAELPYPVRIIFVMGSAAYWQWLCRPDLTRERESLQPFIKLGPWATDPIRALLERLGMNDSTNATMRMIDITEGWYFSLEILASMSRQHPDWKELSQFSHTFTPLTKLKRGGVEKFLRKTGLLDHTEALSVLTEIHKEYGSNPFDQELIELYAEEVGVAELGSDKARAFGHWLSDTNLLSHSRSKTGGGQQYQLKAAVNHALNVWTTGE